MLNRKLALEDLAAEFAKTAAAHDRAASFPFDNFSRLQRANLLALTVPVRYGGGGAGLAEAAHVIGVIAQGEPSTALVLAMQYIQHAAIARSDRFPPYLAEWLSREALPHFWCKRSSARAAMPLRKNGVLGWLFTCCRFVVGAAHDIEKGEAPERLALIALA